MPDEQQISDTSTPYSHTHGQKKARCRTPKLAYNEIILSDRDSHTFAEALRNPPAPSARMRTAAQQYLDSGDE